ncbi:PKD domain-containing protein [Candidatus Bathyarchaeota archaeon]|nr:PKD domain-containing protein [Candidatus Bathyarchaeota archaeon]
MKMKVKRFEIGIMIAALLIATSTVAAASAGPPPIPSDYSGYVTVNGEPAPAGCTVHAVVLGYVSSSVAVEGGHYRYLVISPPDSSYVGEVIEFYLDPDGLGPALAVIAAEADVFQQGFSFDPFNLTFVVLDSTPPVIINVSPTQVSMSGAVITWVTDEGASSLVEYGESVSLGSASELDPGLVMEHSVELAGLAEGTAYYYRVVSADEGGNTGSSSILSFTTESSAPPSSPPSGGGMIIVPGNEPPVAEAGADREVYVGVEIHLSAAGSVDADGAISVYHWFFGDGYYKEGVRVSHTYMTAGTYTAELAVTDDIGATSTDNCTVTVFPLPAAVDAEVFDAVPANQSGYVVDASFWAETIVRVNTTDPVTVTVIRFEGNPHPNDTMPDAGVPKYVDVYVSDPDAVEWPIYVEMAYSVEEILGLDEGSLGMYYWREGAWRRCSDTGVDAVRDVVWAYMGRDEASGSPILMGGNLLPPPPVPAEFLLSELVIDPPEVEAGGRVSVGVVVANVGELAGNCTLVLDVGGGLFADEATVSVEGGGSEGVCFVFYPESVGVYVVGLGGLNGSLTVLAPVAPAEFCVTGLDVFPGVVSVGEEAAVTVTVANLGGVEGVFTVVLEAGGVVSEREVAVGGGASAAVEFMVPGDAWGVVDLVAGGLSGELRVLRPAEFECTGLSVGPAEVEAGGSVAVSLDVCNLGEERGEYSVELEVDGSVVDREDVTLDGGASATVLFEAEGSEGTHRVGVGGLEGIFTVSSPPEPDSAGISQDFLVGGAVVVVLAAGLILFLLRGKGSPAPVGSVLSPRLDVLNFRVFSLVIQGVIPFFS